MVMDHILLLLKCIQISPLQAAIFSSAQKEGKDRPLQDRVALETVQVLEGPKTCSPLCVNQHNPE